jgi:hypothetical protein
MNDHRCFTQRVSSGLLLALGLLPLVAGCGGGVEAEKGLVPVSGRVTLDGGAWPKPGQITFVPTKTGQGEENTAVSSVATFGTDGNFTVGHEGSNGLKPGNYWVTVECLEGEPEMPLPGAKPKDKNVVPPKFRNPEKSGLSLNVEAGKPATANFEVKSK